MKRFIFFVEGSTEQLFLEKLIHHILGPKQLRIIKLDYRNNKRHSFESYRNISINDSMGIDYYIIIINCGGDLKVKSCIVENRELLISKGYQKVVGILDIYPNVKRDQIDKFREKLHEKLPQEKLPIVLVLSTMETEAWFLAEETHFLKTNIKLTPEFLKLNYNFDPTKDDSQLINKPAELLNQIYEMAGSQYKKHKEEIQDLVNKLDYDNMYLNVTVRNQSFNVLVEEINLILE